MTAKVLFILLAVFSIIVGFYPLVYYFVDGKFGILESKSDVLLADTFWHIAFYMHISFGGLALLTGWTQFIKKLRTNRIKLHRQIGKIYVIAALLSAVAGVYIAVYATGGIIPAAGFICLGVVWFYTTLKAWLTIRQRQIEAHQKMMIYSYAACLAAVTLRIYLPFLGMLFNDFIKAYSVVAWLCWVPNLIVAWFLVRHIQRQAVVTATV